MIINSKTLSMSESLEYIKDKDTEKFIKKFVKLKKEKAKSLRKKIVDLGIIQLGEFVISKIIDVLPSNKEELNKVLIDVNLNEDESEKILQTIKEFI